MKRYFLLGLFIFPAILFGRISDRVFWGSGGIAVFGGLYGLSSLISSRSELAKLERMKKKLFRSIQRNFSHTTKKSFADDSWVDNIDLDEVSESGYKMLDKFYNLADKIEKAQQGIRRSYFILLGSLLAAGASAGARWYERNRPLTEKEALLLSDDEFRQVAPRLIPEELMRIEGLRGRGHVDDVLNAANEKIEKQDDDANITFNRDIKPKIHVLSRSLPPETIKKIAAQKDELQGDECVICSSPYRFSSRVCIHEAVALSCEGCHNMCLGCFATIVRHFNAAMKVHIDAGLDPSVGQPQLKCPFCNTEVTNECIRASDRTVLRYE